MFRKLIITVVAFLSAVPAFSHTTKSPTVQPQPVLHLMNDDEFATYLKHLDTDLLHSQEQLKKMDVKSLNLDPRESDLLERSHNRCFQSLDNARDEIQKLLQKQTLRLDLFLLIDLNELARNLDALDEGLVSPAVGESSGAQKSLGYAREVLSMDVALTTNLSTFQHHFLAFTGVIDAALDQSDPDVSQAQPQTQTQN